MKSGRSPKLHSSRFFTLGILTILWATTCYGAQTKLEVLVNFYGANGLTPVALVQGTDGNFYGVTNDGGSYSGGTFFRLMPGGKLTTLYNFCLYCSDGTAPVSLVLGTDGNFYGTTYFGGEVRSPSCLSGCGTIFKITRSGVLTTLHIFCVEANCADGNGTYGALLQARDGNFYGTTYSDNISGETVFRITPSGDFTSLFSFCKVYGCVDELLFDLVDNDGDFWGTNGDSGLQRNGSIVKWTSSGLSIVHRFNGSGGSIPLLIFPANDGNYYGTTRVGGGGGNTECSDIGGCGTLFRLSPEGAFAMLHHFNFVDGSSPFSLLQASDQSFYGETIGGGKHNEGTLFEMTPSGQFTTLYNFCWVLGRSDACLDGSEPRVLIQGTDGSFFGLANGGLAQDGSIVFRVDTRLPAFVKPVPTSGKAGDAITILGYGLNGTSSVQFNGVPAAYTVESDTYIKATAPAGATTGMISVVTPSGTLNSNPQFVVTK